MANGIARTRLYTLFPVDTEYNTRATHYSTVTYTCATSLIRVRDPHMLKLL
jgi:hypothetical protein